MEHHRESQYTGVVSGAGLKVQRAPYLFQHLAALDGFGKGTRAGILEVVDAQTDGIQEGKLVSMQGWQGHGVGAVDAYYMVFTILFAPRASARIAPLVSSKSLIPRLRYVIIIAGAKCKHG